MNRYGLATTMINIMLGIAYLVGRTPLASLFPFIHSLILILGAYALRWANRRNLSSLETCVDYYGWMQIILVICISPGLHVVLGGTKGGRSSDCLVWSLPAPVGCVVWAAYEGRGASNLPVHTVSYFFLIVVVLRIISICIAIGCDGMFATGLDPPPALREVLFYVNHLACPLFIVAIFRHATRGFLTRRAQIIKNTKQVCSKLVRIENLVYSLVPEFKAQRLAEKNPREWHLSERESFSDCTIVQVWLVVCVIYVLYTNIYVCCV
jgi:hypothetical protein